LIREKTKLLQKKEKEIDLALKKKKNNFEYENNNNLNIQNNNPIGFIKNEAEETIKNFQNQNIRSNRVFSFGENDGFSNANAFLLDGRDKLKQRQLEIEFLLQDENERVGRVSKISKKSLLIDEKYIKTSIPEV
jgi:hypothetical protein